LNIEMQAGGTNGSMAGWAAQSTVGGWAGSPAGAHRDGGAATLGGSQTSGGGAGAVGGGTPESGGVAGGGGAAPAHSFGLKRDTSEKIVEKLVSPPEVPALPPLVDLTATVPKPGDQGAENSSTAWAVGYAAKSYHERLEEGWPISDGRYQFSPAWLYNQSNDGVDQGSRISTVMDLVVRVGADTLRFFPYSAGVYGVQPDAASFQRAGRFKAAGWGTVPVAIDAFRQVLNGGQPIVVGMEVFSDFETLSPSNAIYDTVADGEKSRGSHAVTIIGYDDSKEAFKLINSWGASWGLSGYGWIGYSFVANEQLRIDAYTLSDGENSSPSVSNSLYAVRDESLWRIDNDFGDYRQVGTVSWASVTSMVALDGVIYVINNGSLYAVSPEDGTFAKLGTADFGGATLMASLNSKLYIIQGSSIWTITDLGTGSRSQVGQAAWRGATAMSGHEGDLYVIQNSRLHRVNPGTGAYQVLGDADFGGAIAVASLGASLYMTQNGALRKIDPSTGSSVRLGNGDWTGTAAMAVLNGELYIVQNERLHSVSTVDGRYKVLGVPTWWDSTRMAALP
jgi:hypothetical protein